MITKFKLFEIVHGRTDLVDIDLFNNTITPQKDKPQIGDYCIIENGDAELQKFFCMNIGKIVNVGPLTSVSKNGVIWYDVEYESIPEGYDKIRYVTELLYWSHSKKELEAFLRGKQFDL